MRLYFWRQAVREGWQWVLGVTDHAGRLFTVFAVVGVPTSAVAALKLGWWAPVAGGSALCLLLLGEGAFRVWRDAEEERSSFEEALEVDWDDPDDRRIQVKNILSVHADVGETLLANQDREPEACSSWVSEVRSVVGTAFGFHEMHRFMGEKRDLDPTHDSATLYGRLNYLQDLLDRADQLPLSSEFDPEVIKRAWREAHENPEP